MAEGTTESYETKLVEYGLEQMEKFAKHTALKPNEAPYGRGEKKVKERSIVEKVIRGRYAQY